jgi:hypothetical protein
MKENILVIAFSFLLIAIPSVLIGVGFKLSTGVFFAPFLISLGLLFVAGQIYNSVVQQKNSVTIEQYKLKRTELESSQNIEVSCAYCKARNIIPIKLSLRNTFNCKECEQENLIIFQFATAQVTTPLTIPSYGATNGNT